MVLFVITDNYGTEICSNHIQYDIKMTMFSTAFDTLNSAINNVVRNICSDWLYPEIIKKKMPCF